MRETRPLSSGSLPIGSTAAEQRDQALYITSEMRHMRREKEDLGFSPVVLSRIDASGTSHSVLLAADIRLPTNLLHDSTA